MSIWLQNNFDCLPVREKEKGEFYKKNNIFYPKFNNFNKLLQYY